MANDSPVPAHNVGDCIDFNSDPESEQEENHTYRGKIIGLNSSSKQITIKLFDTNDTHSYFTDEIRIRSNPTLATITSEVSMHTTTADNDNVCKQLAEDLCFQ